MAITQPSYPSSTSALVTHIGTYVDAGDNALDARVDVLESGAATQAALDLHTGDATDAHDASAISFVPVGTVAATDAQTAIAEVATDAAAALTTHAAVAATHGLPALSARIARVVWDGSDWTYEGAVIGTRPVYTGSIFWIGAGSADDPTTLMSDGDVWFPSEA
jgi:hypothetical protein